MIMMEKLTKSSKMEFGQSKRKELNRTKIFRVFGVEEKNRRERTEVFSKYGICSW